MPSSRRLRVSPEAETDVRDILQHTLDTWDEKQRDAYAAALTGAFENLLRFPGLGRPMRRPRSSLRRHQVQQHVIYYEVDDQEIRVARVLNVRMDAARHLGG